MHDVTKAELKSTDGSFAICSLVRLKAASNRLLICYNAISTGNEHKEQLKKASWLLHFLKKALTVEDVGWHHVTFVQSVFGFHSLAHCLHARVSSAKKNQKDPRLVRMKPWQRFAVTF